MQKISLRAGLSGLVAMVLTSGVLGQTGDSSMHSGMMNSPHYSIRIENDKVVELSVDGRKIPADSFAAYDPVIRKLMAKAAKDRYQAKLDREKAELDKEQAEWDRLGADRDKERAELDMLKLQKEEAEAKELQQMSGSDRLKMEQDMLQAKLQAEQAQKDMLRAQQDMQQAKRDLEQAMLDRQKAEWDRKLAAEDMEILQRVIGEVVKDGLVPDEKSIVSITLNQDEFLLNGKKQPDAVHKKYATRFLVKPGYKILYHHDR
jgi:colicin import membrane protein